MIPRKIPILQKMVFFATYFIAVFGYVAEKFPKSTGCIELVCTHLKPKN